MLIIGDESKSNGKVPWVTFSLIAINIVVYCAQCFLGEAFSRGFSLVPKEISTLTDLTKPEQVHARVPSRITFEKGQQKILFREVTVTVPQYPGPFPIFLTLLTSMFLHADWIHLFGNMWFLAVFGRNVECALDHGRFLAFYVVCGVIGGLVYTASDAASVLPCLGASGAISGVLGAYVAIQPLNSISIWFGFYIGVIQLPAFVVIGIWFLFQYLAAFQSLEFAGTTLGGTAYWDHLGGFVAGIGTIWAMIAYLKYQQANKPTEEEVDLSVQAEQNEIKADDPFRVFLPESKPIKADKPAIPSAVDHLDIVQPASAAIQSMDKSTRAPSRVTEKSKEYWQ
jgi:membrane associated rhomboid family serine protease